MVYLREKLENTNWRMPYDEKGKHSYSWVSAGAGRGGSDRDALYHILTLSTCTGNGYDSRMTVHAVCIDEQTTDPEKLFWNFYQDEKTLMQIKTTWAFF